MRDPNTYCEACGAVVADDRPDESRDPCPTCGSLSRQIRITVEDTVAFREEIRIKGRAGNAFEVGPHLEFTSGASWSPRYKKWMERTVRVDREADWYEETVVDPDTKEIVAHTAERLSEHIGRGSAKFARPPKQQGPASG